ncbi:MAG: Ig-like domain-containing protein, partial [Myxococcales bacterium]|nr:Ig-like domain-containing protein [Myxococcales bacterium]
MHRLIRSAFSLAAIAVLAACSKGNSSPADAGSTACTTLSECAGNQVCLNSTCVAICHSTAECQTSATPNNVCEEGVCLSPACGNDSQCQSGQVCLGGKCAQKPVASQVASCDVTPNPGDVRVGSTLQMTAIARDSDGKALHFSGITWAASGGNTMSTDGALSASAPGDITVTATAGSRTCASTVHAYGAVAASSLRVTAVNMHTKEPVANAKVVVCNGGGTCAAAITTGADGTVTIAGPDASNDVHVFAPGYNYTSFVQTTATDLLVPLAPYIATNARSGFTSHMCTAKADDPNTGDPTKPQCPSPQGEFEPLQDQGQAVHMAFFGSAVPNSLLDLSVSTLVGPMHSVPLSIPGVGGKTLDLPYGLVLGVATQFFGTNDPRVFADGGLRSLWGIGGNVNLQDVIKVLSPLFDPNATIDVGTLLPKLLGFFGKLQAGAVVGVKAPPNSGTPTFVDQPIQLTTPMRLRYDVTSPALPQLDGKYVDGVIAVAGATNYPLGFIPLGLSAALSTSDGHGGVADPTCDTCDPNVLRVKLAPENGGSEGSAAAVALLALNFGGLTPGSTTKVAISGQINAIANRDLVYTSP